MLIPAATLAAVVVGGVPCRRGMPRKVHGWMLCAQAAEAALETTLAIKTGTLAQQAGIVLGGSQLRKLRPLPCNRRGPPHGAAAAAVCLADSAIGAEAAPMDVISVVEMRYATPYHALLMVL